MENKKLIEKIKIKDIKENKPTENRQVYWSVKTDKGFYSVWKKEIIDKLDENIDKIIEVEITINGKYKNIINFIKAIEPSNFEAEKQKKIDLAVKYKLNSVMVSYAKDIVIALISKCKDLEESKIQVKRINALAKELYETTINLSKPIKEIKEEVEEDSYL